MTVGRGIAVISVAICISVGLGLVSAGAEEAQLGPRVLSVAWEERPDSVDALQDVATAAVEAEVVSVGAGPDLVAASPSEPGGEERIPTQRIGFRTLKTLDGRVPQAFELFKTGSADLYLANDPPYLVGERYVLFVRPRDGDPDTYLPAAPDGRLREEGGRGQVDGTIPGPVDRKLEGETPEQIENRLDG